MSRDATTEATTGDSSNSVRVHKMSKTRLKYLPKMSKFTFKGGNAVHNFRDVKKMSPLLTYIGSAVPWHKV